jgi:XTP/dITP diphosphohydrolase
MDLLIGTGNPGKLREYRQLLDSIPFNILGLDDVGLGDVEIDESGETLEANATLKARAYARASGLLALADDTGLMVDALDGRPGIQAARYAGPGASDADRRRKLLREMAEVIEADRSARFECVIALANPVDDSVVTVTGVCRGQIVQQESRGGQQGFGYDAVFIPTGYDITFAELGPEEKNRISHRGQAAQQMQAILQQMTGE